MPSTSPEITWLIVGVDGNDVSALDGGYPRDSLQKQIGAKRRLLLSGEYTPIRFNSDNAMK